MEGSDQRPRFRELHHYHVLNVALQEMEKRMHDGAERDEVMKDMLDEVHRPCGPTLPDEDSSSSGTMSGYGSAGIEWLTTPRALANINV